MGWDTAFAGIGAALQGGAGALMQGKEYELADRKIAQQGDIAWQRMIVQQVIQEAKNAGLITAAEVKGAEARKTLETKSGFDIALEETRQGGRESVEGMRQEGLTSRQSKDLKQRDLWFGQTFGESVRSHKASENLKKMMIDAQLHGIDIGAEMRKLGIETDAAVTQRAQDMQAATTRRGQDVAGQSNAATNAARTKAGGMFWDTPAAPVPGAAPEAEELYQAQPSPPIPEHVVPGAQPASGARITPEQLRAEMTALVTEYGKATPERQAAIKARLRVLRGAK